MKRPLFIIIILISFGIIRSQSCSNLDFETGNLSGWSVSSGTNTNSVWMFGCCPTPGSPEAVVVSTPRGVSNLGVLPNSPFGGNKVVRVNDSLPGGSLVTRITHTFVVTGNIFQYAIAPLTYSPTHQCYDQPFSDVMLLDSLGNVIDDNSIIPSTNLGVGGTTCTPTGMAAFTHTAGTIVSSCWLTFSVNIAPYMGTRISVLVTSGDCTGVAHQGWCYFDATCASAPPAIVNCGITNISEKSLLYEISIWPNPAKDVLNISVPGNPQHLEFIVYDILGNMVLKQNEFSENNSINIRHLNSGAYFYKFSDGENVKTGKFIKE